MKVDQDLSIYIPKISASIINNRESDLSSIEEYLKKIFADYGIIDKVRFSLINKRDKSKKFYSVIISFKSWFENENIVKLQHDIKNRLLKIIYNNNNFFYVYPQKKFKKETFIDNQTVEQTLNNDNDNNNDNKLTDDINSFQNYQDTLLKLEQNSKSIKNLQNKVTIIHQDMLHYFNILQNNMNNLLYQINNNINLLRQEQNTLFNNYLYNQSYNSRFSDQLSWDDSTPIESFLKKETLYNDDLIEKLRSEYKL